MSKSALKILKTAEQLFNQYSFNSVGVDFIRDQSGCSKTTLYTHYKNKNQLVNAVLLERDLYFKHSLLHYLGDSEGNEAINLLFDWHIQWFQQDTFKGCLFVRVVAESNQDDYQIIALAQQHKKWIKKLILKNCPESSQNFIAESIYTLIEGLISRFVVDGFDENISQQIKKTINLLLNT